MKNNSFRALFLLVLAGQSAFAYQAPEFPFAPGAGEPGTTAIALTDPEIEGWAIQVASVHFGEEVAEEWRDPERALGPASGLAEDVLVLGRGGEVVLAFEGVIQDGDGFDFAVFENGFSDTFLELAFVEVSSDGVHFVRFPNYSVTAQPIGSFANLLPTYIEGFAGKYKIGFGTPFDLSVLMAAHEAALSGEGGFSEEFRTQLLAGFDYLDLNAIRYVKLIDIAGDGRELDAEGYAIYDPYPTVITSGFDLDAVAVLNGGAAATVLSFSEWSLEYGLEAVANGDRDRDGWSNYLEYLFASDPRNARSKPMISSTVELNGGVPSLLVDYTRRANTSHSLVIQTSHNLMDWVRWAGSLKTRISPDHPNGGFVHEALSIPLDNSQGNLYFRFQVAED